MTLSPTPSGDLTNWREPTRDEIDALARRILGAESGEVAAESAADSEPYLWNWNVEGLEARNEKLAFLLRYWTSLRDGRAAPLAGRIDALDLKPILGFVMLLDVLDDGFDGRYRLYGTGVSDLAGRDWTGATVSEMNRTVRSDRALFYRSTYLAAVRRCAPLFTEIASPNWLEALAWLRLVLPLIDESGAVVRFIVGNIPTGRRFVSDALLAEQRARVRGNDSTG